MPRKKKPYKLSTMEKAARKLNRATLNVFETGGVMHEQMQRLGLQKPDELSDWFLKRGIHISGGIIYNSVKMYKFCTEKVNAEKE